MMVCREDVTSPRLNARAGPFHSSTPRTLSRLRRFAAGFFLLAPQRPEQVRDLLVDFVSQIAGNSPSVACQLAMVELGVCKIDDDQSDDEQYPAHQCDFCPKT